MRIKRLLELHRQHKPVEALEQNFGDAYLLEHNQVYKKIRQICIKNKTQFSLEIDTNYLALPLSQLNLLLEKNKIPYYNNVDVLKLVEKNIPDTTDWDEVVDNLKKNYIFHESCHFVARTLADTLIQQNEQIIKLFIEESFANACELMGIAFTQDTAHRIFYEANSYIFVLEAKPALLKLNQQYGQPIVLTFLIYTYLFSNFLHNQLSEKNFMEIIRVVETLHQVKIEKDILKIFKSIAKVSFDLNPRFKMITSGFYLRLCGFKEKSVQVLDFDFWTLVKNQHQFGAFIHRLSQTLV